MKKYILPFLLLLFLTGCSDDIDQVGSASMQGDTNFGFFHTLDVSAHSNADHSVTIVGKDGAKEITLTLSSMTQGASYELGVDTINNATFQYDDQALYATGKTGEGQVTLEQAEGGLLSGTFNFYAYPEGEIGDTITVSQGAFYNVSLGSQNDDGGNDTISGPTTPLPPMTGDCQQAIADAGEASDAYMQAQENGSEQDIQEACQAYRDALQAQIDACGDDSGLLQQTIDELDCGDDNS